MTEPAIWLSLLGPVRAWHGASELDLGAPQQRALLAVLLARAGQPVTMDELVDVLWPDRAPATAPNVVQRYVSQLRRVFGDTGLIVSTAGGYRLDATADTSDILHFRHLRDHDPVAALALRKGAVAADISPAVRTNPLFAAIEAEFAVVAIEAAELSLEDGSADRVLPGLREAASGRPLDEHLQATLMRTLAAAGRPAEALDIFVATRERLADELGIDPGPALAEAHLSVTRSPGSTPTVMPVIRPAQLPVDLPTFAGRRDQVAHIRSLLSGNAGGIVTMSGMGGIGKTTLVVHCAHEVAGDFPDGQLYVNLRGFDPSGKPMDTAEAIRGFLDALGVPPERIPHAVEAQAALYRSMLAGRRMLVVLDNVLDSEQARPLLPGNSGCRAIVTSRTPLTGLVVTDGAQPVPLDLLDPEGARSLLERRLGTARIAAEPAALPDLIALCGGLPLALAIVAARAAINPAFTLADIAAELRESGDPLDGFGTVDPSLDLRAVFSWSYRLLDEHAARLFRYLSIHPGPRLSTPAAASLLGVPVRRARALLAELSRAQLLTEYAAGRYRFHDLLRAYATELMAVAETEEAFARIRDHYVRSATAAAIRLNPRRSASTVEAPELAGVTPETFPDHDSALAWLTAERQVVLKVLDAAEATGAHAEVFQLAWALENLLQRRGFWAEWEASQRLAMTAAVRLGNRAAEAEAQHSLGMMFAPRFLNRQDDSRRHYGEALRLFRESGDLVSAAHLHVRIADLHATAGRHDDEHRQLREALNLYHRLEHPEKVADYISHAYYQLGEYDLALTYTEQAINYLRAAGDVHPQATAWVTMSTIRAALGAPAAALAGLRHAIELYRQSGDRFLHADALVDSAVHQLDLGDRHAAGESLREAAGMLSEIDSPRAVSVQAVASIVAAGDGERLRRAVAGLSSRYAARAVEVQPA
ncbi:AfsR/SARP family transcriptional regulator [Winogradskya humida]|uniref:SARP family transcriptional regulator n=1 Tax=Winogradskya humida TaxID=113566 RepID=A0ABQ3ZP33_9ACTN|nr:BTAD domain-containing putative transcriptional regulator [Actinoplanes humidus]GIE20307.1 SARP family transcriptional regulator [Actinoplanes humidus]